VIAGLGSTQTPRYAVKTISILTQVVVELKAVVLHANGQAVERPGGIADERVMHPELQVGEKCRSQQL
jgi:hypothetical protein